MTHYTADTIVCGSISPNPGTTGARVHAALAAHRGLDYIYLPRRVASEADAEEAIRAMRASGIRGLSIATPYKALARRLAVRVDGTFDSVSALVCEADESLTGYNTDAEVAVDAVAMHVGSRCHVVVYGGGCVASAVINALQDHVDRVAFAARHGPDLSEAIAAALAPVVLVNATPAGAAGDRFPIDDLTLGALALVVDFAVPTTHRDADLTDRARAAGVPTMSGREVAARGAAIQFWLYADVAGNHDERAIDIAIALEAAGV